MAHIETEKKYLIRYPDTSRILKMEECEVWDITQTYLSDAEATHRVRAICQGGETRYVETEKTRITGHSSVEKERSITRGQYEALLLRADPALHPIQKRRLRAPYGGNILEFDLYPFWTRQAVLEIETESDSPAIPPFVDVIRDVSDAREYKNICLASRVPEEDPA